MPHHCAKCKAVANNEYRVVGSEAWVRACSEACARALVAPVKPAATVRERIGHALDAALIGPEQEDVPAIPDATLEDVPDELMVEILKNYPPSALLRIAGTNTRMRAIVLDAKTIRALVASSLARGTNYNGRSALGEWLFAARRAASVGQIPMLEMIIAALDAQPIVQTAWNNPSGWQLTRFMLAVRTENADFARRMAEAIRDDVAIVSMAGFVVRMNNVHALETYLACLKARSNIIRFTFGKSLRRADLFANKVVFGMLLYSPHWDIRREPLSAVGASGITTMVDAGVDSVLVDAIKMHEHEIVAMMLRSERIPLTPKLLDYSTSDTITDMLLANRTINPFGFATISEYSRAQVRIVNVSPTRILAGADFYWE